MPDSPAPPRYVQCKFTGAIATVIGTQDGSTLEVRFAGADADSAVDRSCLSPIEIEPRLDALSALMRHLAKPGVILGAKYLWDPVTERCDIIGEALRLAGVFPERMVEKDYDLHWAMARHYGLTPEQLHTLITVTDTALEAKSNAAAIETLQQIADTAALAGRSDCSPGGANEERLPT